MALTFRLSMTSAAVAFPRPEHRFCGLCADRQVGVIGYLRTRDGKADLVLACDHCGIEIACKFVPVDLVRPLIETLTGFGQACEAPGVAA